MSRNVTKGRWRCRSTRVWIFAGVEWTVVYFRRNFGSLFPILIVILQTFQVAELTNFPFQIFSRV